MYFHSSDDSKYISELKRALVATGMEDEVPIKRTYELKESFRESDIYKKGFVFSNKRIIKDRQNIREIEESKKNAVYYHTVLDIKGYIDSLLDNYKQGSYIAKNENRKAYKFKDIPYNILSSAAESYGELKFSVLKEKYPHLKSMKEFLTSDKFLGNNILEISYEDEDINAKDIFEGLISAFNNISSYIISLKPEYEGSREFYPRKLSDVIKNKSIYLSSIDSNGGIGASQNSNINKDYQLDLSSIEWYAYTDNYGTSEEKLFIKHFERIIRPKLDSKGLKFFLIRNERVPELAIYSFKGGERFEPDFLLFVEKSNVDNKSNYQAYIEPKGFQLLDNSDQVWKESFLLEIAEKHHVKNPIITANNGYFILGLPFYNEEARKNDFDKAVNKWIDNIWKQEVW